MRVPRSGFWRPHRRGLLFGLAALLSVGMAGNARAAELPFTGTFDLHFALKVEAGAAGSALSVCS